MLHEKLKSMRTVRAVVAGALALALSGTALGVSVSAANAQTVFPPVDVGGSFPARVQDIYEGQHIIGMPGYYGAYAPNVVVPGTEAGMMSR